mgnify:CR=1 FL=1
MTPSSNEYFVKAGNFTRLAWLSILAVATLAAALFAGGGVANAEGVGSPDTECQRAFGPGYVGFKIDDVNESKLNGTYKDPETGLTVVIYNTNSDFHTFDYKSSSPVNVIVKGGPDQGTLYPSSDNGIGLHAPFNTSSNKGWYGISHITFCLKPKTEESSKLEITKTAKDPVIAPGGTTAFTLTVNNYGPQTARETVVSDLVPEGLNIDSVDGPCTVSGQSVECVVGDLPAGKSVSFNIVVTADKAAPATTTEDQLDISKVEEQISLQPGETREARLSCGAGGIMTDGSVRVDHVDQGTGDLGSVDVHRVNSLDTGTYGTEVTNNATGQAQAKIFGVCVSKKTSLGNEVSVGPLVSKTFEFNKGINSAELTCGAGTTPVSPGYEVSGANAVLIASTPTAGNGRKFTLDVSGDGAKVTLSIRCLSNLTSGGAPLEFAPISKTIEVGPGAVVSEQLTCAVGYKGIVAGWDYEYGLVPLGNDPQPITRVFRIWNPGDQSMKATLHLLCLKIRTGEGGIVPSEFVNTGYVSSSTPQEPGAVLSDTATVTTDSSASTDRAPVISGARLSGRVLVVSVDAASGRIKVNAASRATVGGKLLRKGSVIGTGRASGSTSKVRLGKLAAKAVKSGKLKRVRVTVKSGGVTASRLVRVSVS